MSRALSLARQDCTIRLAVEVQAAAHFEAILQQWFGHCFEHLLSTEAGMVAHHLQQVATLSTTLASEARDACKGRFMQPCPIYDEEGSASAEDLCKALMDELRRAALPKDRASCTVQSTGVQTSTCSRRASLDVGVRTFAMMDSDGEDDDSEEVARLKTALEAAERRNAELQEQVDQLCQAGETLCPTCDRRFSIGQPDEEADAAVATTGQGTVAETREATPKAIDHSIVAVVRLKPHLPQHNPVWIAPEGTNDAVTDVTTGQDLSFDRVFGPESSTQNLYESCAQELVQSFCQGINATIMAYGQTSSGKTFTMEGNSNTNGIIQLSVEAIFAYFDDLSRSGTKYTMRAAYLEIHNEKLIDLLADAGPVEVKLLDPLSSTSGVQTAPQLNSFEISDANDLLRCLEAGRRHRHVGQTRMNEQSSRSHAVLQLQLESQESSCTFVRRSLLNLVDLAGSESAKHTGAAGERLVEGRNINRSLLALSQVVSSLSDTSRTAPRPSFRDSKLTRVIQQSIGGNARTALICTVSTVDWCYNESKRALEFALRAKSIKNQVSQNIVKLSTGQKASAEVRKLQIHNEKLQLELSKMREHLQAKENCMPKSEENDEAEKEQVVSKRPQRQQTPPGRRLGLIDMANLPEKKVDEKRSQTPPVRRQGLTDVTNQQDKKLDELQKRQPSPSNRRMPLGYDPRGQSRRKNSL